MNKISYEPYKKPLKKTGSFGYYGAVGHTKDGEFLECHVCGKLFRQLGIHAARKHGLKEREYRNEFKLSRKTPLAARNLRNHYVVSAQQMPHAEKERRLKALALGRANTPKKTYDGKSLEQRNIEGTCPDQLLQKVQDFALELGRTPSLKQFRLHYRGLIYIVYRTFGSWKEFIRLAGLQQAPTGRVPTYTKEDLVKLTKQFKKTHGRRPGSSDLVQGLLPSAWTFKKHFGSLSNALREIFGNE